MSTQQFVSPLVSIFLTIAKICHFAVNVQFSTIQRVSIYNNINVMNVCLRPIKHLQLHLCKLKFIKKSCNIIGFPSDFNTFIVQIH